MPAQRISHYHLMEKLGEGAFGVVWRGVHDHDDRLQVAIKCFKPHLTGDPAWAEGLQTEYLALDRLDHRAIVRFRELVVSGTQIALVMELLRGQDLFDTLEPGPLPLERAVEILSQLLDGLAHAHDQGMIHRDIKPSNVFICDDGRVKILDFGLSRAAEGTQASRSGMLSGTMQYLAPEAFDGKVAPASDIYAAGLVAWQMLAGRSACPEGSLARQMGWHCGAGVPDVRTARRDCPAWLADVVAMLVSPDLGERPADGAAALTLLREKRKPIKVTVKPRPRPPSSVRRLVPSKSPSSRPPETVDVRRPVSQPKVLPLEDDSGLLDSVDELAEVEEARRRRAAEQAREAALDIAAQALQTQATKTWAGLARLRHAGGANAEERVRRFIDKYANAKVTVKDDVGAHPRSVGVGEVAQAEAWLASASVRTPPEAPARAGRRAPVQVLLVGAASLAVLGLMTVGVGGVGTVGWWAVSQRDEEAEVAASVEAPTSEPTRVAAPPPKPAPVARWSPPSDYAMVEVPAGSFTMGCTTGQSDCADAEKPAHAVTLTRGFWLGKTEVTQGLWTSVMGENPSRFSSCGDDCPVESASWCDALVFANRLSVRDGLEPVYDLPADFVAGMNTETCNAKAEALDGFDLGAGGYRLPTEAEWEYAARAGRDTLYAGSNSIREVAWYEGNANNGNWTEPHAEQEGTQSVGQLRANVWGLYDMSGNVWEWCWDWFGSYEEGENNDPIGAPRGVLRVLRGGSWFSSPRYARLAFRLRRTPGVRSNSLGLRLARSAVPE